jgi:iron-sulfur cluster assembly protein
MRKLIADTADASVVGIRIAACGEGCAGLSYQMGLETEARAGDAIIPFGDVTVLVDAASKPLLQGACVDFCDSPAVTGFVFDNPNACGSCGSRDSCEL